VTESNPLAGLALHHIGIVVNDLATAIAQYQKLGFGEPERFAVPQQLIEAAVFRAGPGYMELIAPTDSESGTARYLAKRGEGTHHVAYAVPDIDAKLAELKAAGFRLIDETPRIGTHNWRIAFIHPESTHGVLTELVQE
jgi:methylmalonyl-CoA/ethylmalonyl-CoA epimerase